MTEKKFSKTRIQSGSRTQISCSSKNCDKKKFPLAMFFLSFPILRQGSVSQSSVFDPGLMRVGVGRTSLMAAPCHGASELLDDPAALSRTHDKRSLNYLSPICRASLDTVSAQLRSLGSARFGSPTPCKCFFLTGDHLGPPGSPSSSIPFPVPIHVACKSLSVFSRTVLSLLTSLISFRPCSLMPLFGLSMST